MSDEVTVARLRSQQDNTKVTPRELLALAMADIDEGQVKADRAIVILIDTEGGADAVSSYRCGLRPVEEVGYLTLKIAWLAADRRR